MHQFARQGFTNDGLLHQYALAAATAGSRYVACECSQSWKWCEHAEYVVGGVTNIFLFRRQPYHQRQALWHRQVLSTINSPTAIDLCRHPSCSLSSIFFAIINLL